jgi:hypothetical protein
MVTKSSVSVYDGYHMFCPHENVFVLYHEDVDNCRYLHLVGNKIVVDKNVTFCVDDDNKDVMCLSLGDGNNFAKITSKDDKYCLCMVKEDGSDDESKEILQMCDAEFGFFFELIDNEGVCVGLNHKNIKMLRDVKSNNAKFNMIDGKLSYNSEPINSNLFVYLSYFKYKDNDNDKFRFTYDRGVTSCCMKGVCDDENNSYRLVLNNNNNNNKTITCDFDDKGFGVEYCTINNGDHELCYNYISNSYSIKSDDDNHINLQPVYHDNDGKEVRFEFKSDM